MSIASPCIGVCALDAEDVCIGCFRTADEITEWSLMDHDEKQQCVEDSAKRAIENGMSL